MLEVGVIIIAIAYMVMAAIALTERIEKINRQKLLESQWEEFNNILDEDEEDGAEEKK